MSGTIAYKGELFDLVNDLTAIHKSIAFERVDDQVVIRKSDKEKTIPYILKAPAEYFDIDEIVAFYQYDDFYRYYSNFKGGTLQISGLHMVLKEGRRTSKYTLSESDGIINGPKRVNFGESDATFTLTKEDLDDLVKMTALVKGDGAFISCVGDEVTITIHTEESKNTYEKIFECERNSEFTGKIEFNILANRFLFLPSKRNYVIDIKKEKQLRISLIHDDIELNIYSGTTD